MLQISDATRNWRVRLNNLIVYGNHTLPARVGEDNVCHCLNCGTDFIGNFCPNCGQSSKTRRLTFGQALDNFLGAFVNMERGLVHTCLELLYRPGYMMYDYVKGHRVEYVKPIQLLFLLSTLYLLLKYVLYIGWDLSINIEMTDPDQTERFQWIRDIMRYIDSNQAISSLLTVVIMLFPYWLSFRRTKIGKEICLAEFFFVMVYVSCQQMLFSLLHLPLQRLAGEAPSMGMRLSVIFMAWSLHQFFHLTWRQTILRALLGCVFAFMLILLLFALIFAGVAVVYGLDPDQVGEKLSDFF